MDQVDNLILKVQGEAELKSLNAELGREQKALADLVDQLRTGAIAQAAFDQAATKSAGQVVALQEQITKLAGSRGINGQGILGASYAAQDFAGVIGAGGSFSQALNSVQNNLAPVLQSFGVMAGPAGVISLVSVAVGALTPLLGKLWESFDDKGAVEKAKEALEDLMAKAKEAHKVVEGLTNAPTDPEKLAAEGIGLVLKQRPKADVAKQAIAAGFTPSEAHEALTPQERDTYWQARDFADKTDEQLQRQADRETITAEGHATPEAVAFRFRQLKDDQRQARHKRDEIMGMARNRRAEGIISGALTAGPAGDTSRIDLLRRTKGVAGLEELQNMTPEAIQAAEADYEEGLPAFEAIAESGRKLSRGLKKVRAKEKAHATFNARLKSSQTEAILGKHTAEIREKKREEEAQLHQLEQGFAGTGAEFAQVDMDQARRQVTRGAQQLNLGTPTNAQADDMARQVLALTREGVATNDAILSAIQAKSQQIAQLQMRLQQQRARAVQFGMGSDQSGQFSLLPPIW
jgi:hypothetical protein